MECNIHKVNIFNATQLNKMIDILKIKCPQRNRKHNICPKKEENPCSHSSEYTVIYTFKASFGIKKPFGEKKKGKVSSIAERPGVLTGSAEQRWHRDALLHQGCGNIQNHQGSSKTFHERWGGNGRSEQSLTGLGHGASKGK